MARLAERYPDDTEAAIFYALALNEAVDLNDKTYAKQFKAAAILQAIEAKQPNHKGRPALGPLARFRRGGPLHDPPTLAHGRPALGGWRFIERRLAERNRRTMLGGVGEIQPGRSSSVIPRRAEESKAGVAPAPA